MIGFSWASPRTVSEAAASSTTVAAAMAISPDAMASTQVAVAKAGGIDLLDLLKENLLAPSRVVSLAQIPGLDAIVELPAGGLRVGSMAKLASLADHSVVRKRYLALADALRNTASPQIRNVATLGGNLLQRPRCWYLRAEQFRCLRKGGRHCFALAGENRYHAIFDNKICAIVHPSTAATALVALGATVELVNAEGGVRRVLLEDFFVAPASDVQRENDLKAQEILTAIELPAISPGTRMAHCKQSEKDAFDWPLADVAVVLDMSPEGRCRRASIVLGAAAPVPHRAKAAETVLSGRHIDAAVATQAGRAAVEGATPLSQNAYKLPLFEVLVRRSILQATAG
ncbi:MAG TPA: FAD binding domain-containing protein [Burkholderiaceae bacterium]|nr:FAD binding domain-containing protein [Burkholderiaceae bacterium]